MLAGVTEADEQRPERIEQTLALRTETVFASCLTATSDIKWVAGNPHAQAGFSGPFVTNDKPVIGMTKLAGKLFIMLRTIPDRVFTFGFCGMLSTCTAGQFFDWRDKEIILCSGIDILPETG
ncbi:hypothetical protein D3C81_1519140 [compost metagenome]